MSSQFELNLENRSLQGKGASRRLRRLEKKVPGILYGGDQAPLMISILSKDLEKSLQHEAFFTHILTLNIDGQAHQAVIKALQRHPAKNFPLHVDFQRVDAHHKIHMHVPLHYINQTTCIGVKQGSGIISHNLSEVEVTCLPSNLPEYIEVDMLNVSLGQTLHLSDLKIPAGVELLALAQGADHDLPVCNVHAPRGASSEDESTSTTEPESGNE